MGGVTVPVSAEIEYSKVIWVANAAVQKNRPILDVALEMTDIDEDNLRALLDPENLVGNIPGKPE